MSKFLLLLVFLIAFLGIGFLMVPYVIGSMLILGSIVYTLKFVLRGKKWNI